MDVVDGSAHLHTLQQLLVVLTQHELCAQKRMDIASTQQEKDLRIEPLTGVLNS